MVDIESFFVNQKNALDSIPESEPSEINWPAKVTAIESAAPIIVKKCKPESNDRRSATRRAGQTVIVINHGEMDEQYRKAENVLAENGFYSRANALVTIEDGKITPVKAVNLRVNYLSELVSWEQEHVTKMGIESRPVDPPKDVCDALVAAGIRGD